MSVEELQQVYAADTSSAILQAYHYSTQAAGYTDLDQFDAYQQQQRPELHPGYETSAMYMPPAPEHYAYQQGELMQQGYTGVCATYPTYAQDAAWDSVPLPQRRAPGAGVTPLGPNGKPKRRRVATVAQRRAANIRERRRMFNLNEAFDELRKRVPTFAYEKRLSRIETLRLAITYMAFMSDVADGKNPDEVKLHSLKMTNAANFVFKKEGEEEEDALVATEPPSPNNNHLLCLDHAPQEQPASD